MCANCGCGYAWYDDLETGAGANEKSYKEEAAEKSEA